MPSLPLLVGVLLACILVGAMPALVTALKPRLEQLLNLDHARVDRLERMRFFLAWVGGMPLAGYLVDVWKREEILVAGCFGIAATLAFFGVAHSPRWVGAMSFLLGLATSFVVVATICLAPAAIPAACPAAALNAGFIGIGLGSFAPRGLLARLERWFGLRRAMLVLGLAALIPASFVFAAIVANDIPQQDPHTTPDFFRAVPFWLLAAMLVFYYPIESALDIWSGPFLNELGYRNRPGRMMLVGFWLAFLIARLAMWFLMGPRNEIWLLFLCALTSAIVLGNLVGAYGASAGGTGFWLVGACYGPLLPGILGLLLEASVGSQGLAVGSVLAVAGLHDALAHPIMQRTMHAREVRKAMRIPLLMTLLMLAPLLIYGLVLAP
ncbi:MAG: hypothetical protein L0Y71_11535 [Gemmataceae bacterium]|nr:hypothetical protein [Gemmataceae bacterium]